MLIAAIVVFMVALGIAIGLALVKANPSEDEIAEAQQQGLAELEGDPQTDPQPSSGGAHSPLPSEAGRASPKHLDLPRLG